MKPLVPIWLLFYLFILSFLIDARPDPLPLLPSASTLAPISPVSATLMAALSPGQVVVHEHHLNKKMLIALIIVSAALCATVSCLFCICIVRRKNPKSAESKSVKSSGGAKGVALSPFLRKFNSMKINGRKGSVSLIEFSVLESSTNNFSDSNVLGKGGFGCVYKARLNDDFFVAVKRLDGGGQDTEREFENEVDLLSKIRHSNVISLLGYCIHRESRFIVYELMQNGSLETQLHGSTHGSALTWPLRMKIALDAARGLEYLHESCNPTVIHRDLKSSNILLDSNFNAKLSDFGLSVTVGNQNKNNIKLSGTLGYVAPEYILDGKLTEKSDVYAFGVVLLELLIGRKPVEKLTSSQCQSIVTWAMPQLTDRAKLPNIIDPAIRDTMDLKHLYQVAAVAVLCVQPEPSYRPLITDVLHSLIPLVPAELGGTLRVTESAPVPGEYQNRTMARWLCTQGTKNMLVKIVHPGGHVELHDRPLIASEIMLRNPKCCVAYPHVFQNPWAIVSPDTTLMLGKKFYVVPVSTIRKLQRHSLKRSPSASQDVNASQSCQDNDEDDDQMVSACWLFTPRRIGAGGTRVMSELEREGCFSDSTCFTCLSSRAKTKEEGGEDSKDNLQPEGVNRERNRDYPRKKMKGSPKRHVSMNNWEPILESISEE
ncbi:hypothetical protein GIB67_021707 [Kingdonia uniflora]|uniref:Protein kinase domain-containing protein n=1 Tax=Kingdonia uniflora TaxID=39325 RepID=A0A7J7LM36_9MAGN|nr:hypothetical protein GIB67_021707 [Kingdonia uniflora]